MKKLFLSLATTFAVVGVWAQAVTLQFAGTNKNRNYQVVINGTTYNSANATASGSNKKITLNTLPLGSHTMSLYQAGVPINSNNALYTNSFQLRSGYDMTILVRANGGVTFTEKKNNNYTASSTGTYNAEMAMSTANFNRLAQSVRGKWSQSSRISTIRSAFTSTANYFTTDQVGQLLSYVSAEPTRLELAKVAYARVIDAANYRDLYELFSSQSLRSELDFFLRTTTITPAGGGTTNNTTNTNTNYGTRTPMADYTFSQLLQTMNNQYNQAGRVAVATDALKNTNSYFTTAQLRQLISAVSVETDRLTLAKLAYARVADVSNFTSLYDLFYNQASRTELDNYIRYGTNTSTTVNSNYANRVAISDADFSRMDLKVRFHLRQSSTVAEIKNYFNTNNYFTAQQIRQWLGLVSSETDRVALAKLAYKRITDPTTFTSLYDLFPSQASRTELDAYIAANRY